MYIIAVRVYQPLPNFVERQKSGLNKDILDKGWFELTASSAIEIPDPTIWAVRSLDHRSARLFRGPGGHPPDPDVRGASPQTSNRARALGELIVDLTTITI